MQIKSWQIALVAIIPSILAIYRLLMEFSSGIGNDYALGITGLIIYIFTLLLISLIVAFLISKNKILKKIGAIFSIFLGAIGIVYPLLLGDEPLVYISGPLLILAGIHYFWKEQI